MARRATSLGPKPSLFVFLLFFFVPLFFRKKAGFPLERTFLFIFDCLPLFLLSLFWPPPFSVLFLCLSLSLSIVILKNNIKVFNYKVFDHQSFLIFVGFLSSFSFKSPFLTFVFFLILSFVFCSTSMFSLKNASSKNTIFWSRGGLQHDGFLSTCVLQNMKTHRFLGHFYQFLLLFKKHYKIGILAHFKGNKLPKKSPFWGVIILSR